MKSKRHHTIPLPSEMKLLGDGPSFQNTLCDMLNKTQGFDDFAQPELLYLAQHMKAYRVPAGVTIFRERDRNSYLGLLLEGRISVHKDDSDDRDKLLNVVPTGTIFGEVSVIDDHPYSASLVAETDATIALMSRESFRKCVANNPVIGVRLLNLIAQLLCARLRTVSGRLVDYIEV